MINHDMMPLRITICGIDELAVNGFDGITHVLSILDPGWPDPPELAKLGMYRRLRLHFHDVIEPRPDRIAPERWDVELLLAFGRDLANAPGAAEGSHLLVHCHAGVSRSTAAAVLILAQHHPDRPAEEAMREIARLRPRAWPNLRMLEIGDAALGRGGEIVLAARAHYRRLLDREPWLAAAMIEGGRRREVNAARDR